MRLTRAFSGISLVSSLLLPAISLARDGVLEISQSCPTTTGCLPGDTGGYPATITSAVPARSFTPTSDLVTTSGQ